MRASSRLRVVVALEPRMLREAVGHALRAHDVDVEVPDGSKAVTGVFDVAVVSEPLPAGVTVDEIIDLRSAPTFSFAAIVATVERHRRRPE